MNIYQEENTDRCKGNTASIVLYTPYLYGWPGSGQNNASSESRAVSMKESVNDNVSDQTIHDHRNS